MREEEKLARNVYLTLSTRWGLSIFQNTSQSDQTHTNVVKELIESYNLTDPALNTVKVFANPDPQTLYNTLIDRGNQSLSDALQVGAAIGHIDILDLEKYLCQTDNTDIQQVFTNLKHGSYNHLSAFPATLYRQTGEIYQPQYLSPEVYQAILETLGDAIGNGGGVQGVYTSATGCKHIPSRLQKWLSGSVLSLLEKTFALADRLARTHTGEMVRESKIRVVVTQSFVGKERVHRNRTRDITLGKQLVQKAS